MHQHTHIASTAPCDPETHRGTYRVLTVSWDTQRNQTVPTGPAYRVPALYWDLHKNQTQSLTFEFIYCPHLEERTQTPKSAYCVTSQC